MPRPSRGTLARAQLNTSITVRARPTNFFFPVATFFLFKIVARMIREIFQLHFNRPARHSPPPVLRSRIIRMVRCRRGVRLRGAQLDPIFTAAGIIMRPRSNRNPSVTERGSEGKKVEGR